MCSTLFVLFVLWTFIIPLEKERDKLTAISVESDLSLTYPYYSDIMLAGCHPFDIWVVACQRSPPNTSMQPSCVPRPVKTRDREREREKVSNQRIKPETVKHVE